MILCRFDLLSQSSPGGMFSSPLSHWLTPPILSSHPGISHPVMVTSGPLHDLSPLSTAIDGTRYWTVSSDVSHGKEINTGNTR